ncbi:phosphotransferase [Bradyrhizobium sp. SSBR45G]|uniref:aminoglycoside phosphotransferase family protein n=1 Tax=unclassified Bradyrhizobium TaxID=2631580 RepID=UPI002342A0AB|nr:MULTISPECIES: aminoglycoside 3'-phosphotransferase/choline kinase family protein [unclassified Bradyrhizobium]GLH78671.1 phosphotransferase [Bradyrhizobium sp. SSBR45G]GLH87501.1 phosphotransferase [Bradyrhizobium sp. SSBR45R]
MLLPSISDAAQLKRLRADVPRWLPVASDIARAHGHDHARLVPFPAGTNLVVALGDELILKIFPSLLRGQFLSERTTLRLLAGRVDNVSTPELRHEGQRDGWSYLIMTRLDGVPASEVWGQMPEQTKQILLWQLGRLIAAVQRVPSGELLALGPRWRDFLQKQMAGCHARHQRLGLPAVLLAGLDDLLREASALLPDDPPPVILTGEYIPENFLVARDGDGWRVSGLFDFGDVMTGFGEYDLLGPSAFMAAGHPRRVRALFEGYGVAAADMDWQLKRRLMALLMLHQASDPVRHICIPDWPSKVRNFDELQRLIWPD